MLVSHHSGGREANGVDLLTVSRPSRRGLNPRLSQVFTRITYYAAPLFVGETDYRFLRAICPAAVRRFALSALTSGCVLSGRRPVVCRQIGLDPVGGPHR